MISKNEGVYILNERVCRYVPIFSCIKQNKIYINLYQHYFIVSFVLFLQIYFSSIYFDKEIF